jgi:hypothetical protein
MSFVTPTNRHPHDSQLPNSLGLESKFNALSVEDKLQEAEESTGTPTLELPGPFIDDTTISRLAMTLLGHVLYLKNQIPLYALTSRQRAPLIVNKSSRAVGEDIRA